MSRTLGLRSLGVIVWIAFCAAAVGGLWSTSRASGSRGTSLVRYLAGPTARPYAVDVTRQLQVGDPIFWQDEQGDWSQIGYVQSLHEGDANSRPVRLAWHTGELSPMECELSQYVNRGRLEDITRLLLPAEKRLRIQQRLTDAFQMHGDEISQAITPIVEQSLRESLPLIEAEFRRSVVRHRDDVDAVAARINRDVIHGRLVPLAKEELLPIVRRHAQEPAETIGRELWDRASLWRFGWRAVADATPLPQRSLVQEEWRRFVDEEATEVIEAHMDEMTVAVQRILADAAADPVIRGELAAAAETVAADPMTRELVRTLLREAVVENAALRERWREIWTSERASAAIAMTGQRLEPVVRAIGDDIFGTREGGIDPDFARVLRNQILGKDRRWIVARRGTPSGRLQIHLSTEPMAYPVVYLAEPVVSTTSAEVTP